jgi:hypothetical protein
MGIKCGAEVSREVGVLLRVGGGGIRCGAGEGGRV